MSLKFKIDVLAELKKHGYNTNTIRKEGLFSQSTLQKFKHEQPISWDNIERLCRLLNCQPGDILEYTEDREGE